MNVSLALEADRAGDAVKAAELYEGSIAAGVADKDIILNLSIIYWQACSFGFAAAHRLPESFVNKAEQRYRQLLADALSVYGNDASVVFWHRYIQALDFGEEFTAEDCADVRRLNDRADELALCDADNLETSVLQDVSEKFRRVGTFRYVYLADVLDGILKRKLARERRENR